MSNLNLLFLLKRSFLFETIMICDLSFSLNNSNIDNFVRPSCLHFYPVKLCSMRRQQSVV